MNHFKGKQFQKDVIIISVGYYLRYNLSYRDVQEMLYDRGINVSHTTIYRWVQEYGIKSGKRKIDSPFIRGKWTKLISEYQVCDTVSFVRKFRSNFNRSLFIGCRTSGAICTSTFTLH